MSLNLKQLSLGQTQVIALDQEYFESYGGGQGYENSYSSFGFNIKNLISQLARNDIYPTTILDCGSALGHPVRDLRRAGFEAYGIEIADYAIQNIVPEAKPYCRQMDMRNLGQFKAGSFDFIFTNSLMYLTEPEIHEWLKAAHKVCNLGINIVNPFSDYPETIPEDSHRKTLQTKQWWIDTVPKHGFKLCPGTMMLFRKT